jgi:hypothetical protein
VTQKPRASSEGPVASEEEFGCISSMLLVVTLVWVTVVRTEAVVKTIAVVVVARDDVLSPVTVTDVYE